MFSFGKSWWSRGESNSRPHACKARALPAELLPRFLSLKNWWAQVDLNHLPPRYQHGALPAELWAQTTCDTDLLPIVRPDTALTRAQE